MEVLNRLCDFGDESDRRAFLEKLFQFMEDKGSPITVVPAISKTPIDLYRLYHLVKDRGGLWEVIILFLWSVECLFIGTPPTPFLRIELSKNNSCYLAPKFSHIMLPQNPCLLVKKSKNHCLKSPISLNFSIIHTGYVLVFENLECV